MLGPDKSDADEIFGNQNPEEVSVKQLEDAVSACFMLKQQEDELLERVDAIKKERLEKESFVRAQLDFYGKDRHVSSHGTFEIRKRLSFTTPKTMEDKHAFFKWLQDKQIFWDYASVNSQALNGLLKAEKEANPEVAIPGIQEPSEYVTVVLRKGK